MPPARRYGGVRVRLRLIARHALPVAAAVVALALSWLGVSTTDASAAVPNDPSFSLQWADSNIGQEVPFQDNTENLGPLEKGTPGVDDRALAAWRVSTGSRSVVVGELDSGVQYGHPDLAANIWSNPGGIGGCAAGTHGFDAIAKNCDPQDADTSYGGHGTHVAGIIGAVGNNGTGVAGVDWQTTILPVKWVQSAGEETGELLNALRWLLKAREAGVNIRVVNDSLTFSGTPYSSEVKRAIEALGKQNVLFVTAAGNSGNNNDEESVRRYPCGYGLANEICVTATNNRAELPPWANYGPHTVDLSAPGVSIYSTLREGKYGYLTGGSMASAQVAGAAALLLSVNPALTAAEVKTRILGTVDRLPALEGKVITGGTLDICRALPGCEPAASEPESPPTGQPPGSGNQPGSGGGVGVAGSSVRAAQSPAVLPTLLGRSLRASPRGVLHVRLACPVASGGCAGRFVLRLALPRRRSGSGGHGNRQPLSLVQVTVASGTFAIAPGKSVAITLRLPLAVRRLLAHMHVLHGVAILAAPGTAGGTPGARLPVSVRAPLTARGAR